MKGRRKIELDEKFRKESGVKLRAKRAKMAAVGPLIENNTVSLTGCDYRNPVFSQRPICFNKDLFRIQEGVSLVLDVLTQMQIPHLLCLWLCLSYNFFVRCFISSLPVIFPSHPSLLSPLTSPQSPPPHFSSIFNPKPKTVQEHKQVSWWQLVSLLIMMLFYLAPKDVATSTVFKEDMVHRDWIWNNVSVCPQSAPRKLPVHSLKQWQRAL